MMRYDSELEGHDELTGGIIGAALEVHRELGPGLLESTYEKCLCLELETQKIEFARQTLVPILYKGQTIEAVYRLDLVVDNSVIIEIKAVEKLLPVHDAQLLTYMRHTGVRTGLLFNFNEPVLKIKRLSL
ncbi:MAG TPA: GxxExxY protein [Gemmatimonadaceae bacterium]|nr:GxxExxY protein [Gemmatimonadaceae bacterium]